MISIVYYDNKSRWGAMKRYVCEYMKASNNNNNNKEQIKRKRKGWKEILINFDLLIYLLL
jgi:hypothetical protein